MFPKLQKGCGGISDMNNGAVKNNIILCRFSFSDVLYVVAALFNPSNRVYSRTINMEAVICPANIIICK